MWRGSGGGRTTISPFKTSGEIRSGPGCLKDRVRVEVNDTQHFFLFQISLFKLRTLIPGVRNTEREPQQSRTEKQFRASTEGDREEENGPFEHAVCFFFSPPSLTAAVVPKTQKLMDGVDRREAISLPAGHSNPCQAPYPAFSHSLTPSHN